MYNFVSLFFPGQYIAAVIVLLSLSTTCTVLVLRCHHRGVLIRGKMPRYVRTVVFSGLATILCMRTKVDRILEDLQAPKVCCASNAQNIVTMADISRSRVYKIVVCLRHMYVGFAVEATWDSVIASILSIFLVWVKFNKPALRVISGGPLTPRSSINGWLMILHV